MNPTEGPKSRRARKVPMTELGMVELAGADQDIASRGPDALVHVTEQVTIAQSEGRLVFKRFVRHKAAMSAVVVFVLVVLLAVSSIGIKIFGWRTPHWWKLGYTEYDSSAASVVPTLSWSGLGAHPFGTDTIGHDYFAMVMRGTQQSLTIALIVGLVATVLGTVMGALAGYFRGVTETVIMRFTDVLMTIPLIVIASVIGFKLQDLEVGVALLGVGIGVVVWTGLGRIVRGEFLSLREKEFVEAARSVGARAGRIIFRHILPNTIGVIIVYATLTISSAILLETALSFLGFGVKPPDVSLGLLIGSNRTAIGTRPWLFWFPGLFIVLIALTVNFIGDGLRDAFDPKQNRG